MLECEYMYKGASRDLGPCVSRARKFCSRCDVRYRKGRSEKSSGSEKTLPQMASNLRRRSPHLRRR